MTFDMPPDDADRGDPHGESSTETLPYICQAHPAAQIRHSFDSMQYAMNGYPAGESLKSNHRYECAECGRELAATPKPQVR